MKKFLVLFLLFLFIGRVEALDIVYPKVNPVKINAPSSFFIGSVNPGETLKINDIDVRVSPIGAFAQVVSLNYGKNNFLIQAGNDKINFVIYRPNRKNSSVKTSKLLEYPAVSFCVNKDNTPLRTTPVGSGVNRMAHLPLGTMILVNGEQGNFYRVYLNSVITGWVSKSDVTQSEFFQKNALLNAIQTKEEKDYCIYEANLSKKVPFILKEENGLTLQLFNIEAQPDNTYCINIPMQKLMGYDISYDDKKFILKVRKPPEINSKKPFKNIIIAVDAGHGGCELGAIGCCGDKEKDINLAIAKNLKRVLENRGAKVIMTREDDSQISLQKRVDMAENEAILLISIHSNALPDGKDPNKNRGTSVYYYHPQAKLLAESILNSMTKQLGTQNDRVRQGSLALVRPTSSVSVLVEVAYMINPDDTELLIDKNFQQNCAKAIADGIEDYLLK